MSLQSDNSDKPTLTLESVKLNFLNWRRDPHKAMRIPELLWNEVMSLLSAHPKNKVLTSLGIGHSQLRRYLKSRERMGDGAMDFSSTLQQKKSVDKPHFIKAIITTPVQPYFDVVFTKPSGVTLKINKVPQEEIIKLTQLFVG